MKKYFEALNKVTWPTSKEVSSNFAIVLFGIVTFAIFFIVVDLGVSKLLEFLMNSSNK